MEGQRKALRKCKREFQRFGHGIPHCMESRRETLNQILILDNYQELPQWQLLTQKETRPKCFDECTSQLVLHNKCHMLKQQTLIFSQFQRLVSPRSRSSRLWLLLRACSCLAVGHISCCTKKDVTSAWCVCVCTERERTFFLFYKATNLTRFGSYPYNLIQP